MSEFLFDAPAADLLFKPKVKGHAAAATDADVPTEEVEPPPATTPPPTLGELAVTLRTTEEQLRAFGLADAPGGLALSTEDHEGRQHQHALSTSPSEALAGWDRNAAPYPYGLGRYVASSWTRLVLVPHEADCWPLWLQGIPAVALPSAGAVRSLDAAFLEGVRGVYVVQPGHAYGKRFVDLVTRQLRDVKYRGPSHLLSLPAGEADVWSLYLNSEHHERRRYRAIYRDRKPLMRKVLGLLASEVKADHIEWLWPGRVPLKKVTIVDGDPGLGKSTIFEADIAARTTKGIPMPGGNHRVQGGVVIVNAEDGAGDTIRPRLEAAGADLDRCLILTTISYGDGERLPAIPDDIDLLREAAQRVQAKLIVIDPIMAYFGAKIDSNSDQKVRQAMGALKTLAEETGAAVVLVRHLNKSGGSKAVYRGGGSIGIAGAARSVLLVAKHPEAEDPETGQDDGRRVIAVSKSNLGKAPQSLGFRMETVGESSGIRWTGEEKFSADDLVSPPSSTAEEKSAMEDAVEFLRDMLAKGPLPAKEVQDAARHNDVSPATLRRARPKVGVESKRQGFGPGSTCYWCLPGQEPPGSEESA